MGDGFQRSWLVLQTGHTFSGWSPPWQKGNTYGEVVFTTGMTGYPESLTDPSFAGQILTFTYPLIGNYGVPDEKLLESTRIHVKGVVTSTVSSKAHHICSLQPFHKWLFSQKIPFISGVDTRALTKLIRHKGTVKAVMTKQRDALFAFDKIREDNLVQMSSSKKKKQYGTGKKTILVIDCGIKENILRCLKKLPVTICQVPYDYDFSKLSYDGLFISNGPGDPVHCVKTIFHLQEAIKRNTPIFGICLGAQLLALAAGAKTYKLPFGHRGQNQPCMHLETKKCYITSQNHGYAIDESSLPKSWKVTYKNLNDHSIEGIRHQNKPFFAVQFHPEGGPGPTDTTWLFEEFYQCL